MSNIERKMELAKEAVELIKEFGEEASIVGDNPIKSIEIKEDGSIIEIDHEYDGLEEYQLSKISSIFLSEMRGWGPCSAGFYEAISLAEDGLEDKFKSLSKTEFKEYVGNLKYAEYRCEEIYIRLEDIEKEAKELI